MVTIQISKKCQIGKTFYRSLSSTLSSTTFFFGSIKTMSENVYWSKIPPTLNLVNFSDRPIDQRQFTWISSCRLPEQFWREMFRFLTWCFPTVTLVECCIPRASRYRWVVGAAVIVRSGCDTHCLECYTEI